MSLWGHSNRATELSSRVPEAHQGTDRPPSPGRAHGQHPKELQHRGGTSSDPVGAGQPQATCQNKVQPHTSPSHGTLQPATTCCHLCSPPLEGAGQPRTRSAGSRAGADPTWAGWWHGVQMFAQLCCDRASRLREGMLGKAPVNWSWTRGIEAAEGKAQRPVGPAESGQGGWWCILALVCRGRFNSCGNPDEAVGALAGGCSPPGTPSTRNRIGPTMVAAEGTKRV